MRKRSRRFGNTSPKRERESARREAGHVFIPTGRGRALDIGGQLDVARCPLCDGPMTPRLSKQGSYFHCACHARQRDCPQRSPVEPVPAAATIASKRAELLSGNWKAAG